MQQLVDNRYRVVSPLGSGGMAEVYLAHDDVLDRDVALKVMSGRYAYDDEFVERFRREAQSAAALSHPNIVSIYDRGESEDGTYYIAMEYLSGGTLKDRLCKRGSLAPRTAAAVALQIAEALQAAHRAGVVHRDIKPHNVLITASGDVKVGDFGIARAASSSTMTRTGSILGTAHYISPEQAMGEPVGPQSDLYSLGVVLYEMLTGELPFDAETPIGIAMQHVNGHLRPPKELNPGIPGGINAVVVRLLAKDPDDRYADAGELMDDLERVLDGLDPANAATRATRRLQPTQPPRIAPQPRTAPRKEAGPGRGLWVPVLLAILVLLALLGGLAYAALGGLGEAEPEVPDLPVPSLVGYASVSEARAAVGDDFEIEIEDDAVESRDPEGTIVDQSPRAEPGRTAEQGSTIYVDVNGTQVADVPDVEGDSQEEAERRLEGAGFEVEVENEESSAANEGYVTGQDPRGGGTAEAGSTVEITVGEGPETVQIPDLYNLTPEAARQALEAVDLSLGEQTRSASDEVAEGRISSQNPSADSEAEAGSTVDVTVSSGPERLRVPDVVGQDVEEAQQTLYDAYFGYTVEEVTSDEPAGTVVETDPEAGTLLDPNERLVTLSVSAGPPAPPPPPSNTKTDAGKAAETKTGTSKATENKVTEGKASNGKTSNDKNNKSKARKKDDDD